MKYWNNYPEVLDEITVDALPEPWFSLIGSGEITLQKVPIDILVKATIKGETEYWQQMEDAAHERLRETA